VAAQIAVAGSSAGSVQALPRRTLGAFALLPVPVVLLAYVDPHRFGEWLCVAFALAWIALAVHAISRAPSATIEADG
jgi:hypothetical protein